MAVAPKADWIAIEGEYRAGKRSLRDIGGDYGVSEGAIRKKAKAAGWIRDPSGTKRERVKAIMAGAGTQEGTQYALRTLEAEANQDATDMAMGLEVARACLRNLHGMAQVCDNPKELKLVAETNKIAVETIRRIRGLDDATGPEMVVKWEGGE